MEHRDVLVLTGRHYFATNACNVVHVSFCISFVCIPRPLIDEKLSNFKCFVSQGCEESFTTSATFLGVW